MQTCKGMDEQADVYARKHPCDNHLIWKRQKGTGMLGKVEKKSKPDLSWNSLEDEQGKVVNGGCIPNSLSTYEDGENRSLRRKEKKERENKVRLTRTNLERSKRWAERRDDKMEKDRW